jgi:hypothetical protein
MRTVLHHVQDEEKGYAKPHIIASIYLLVPEEGVEPSHLAALDFESSVSTNSTTLAMRLTKNTS